MINCNLTCIFYHPFIGLERHKYALSAEFKVSCCKLKLLLSIFIRAKHFALALPSIC